MNIRANIFNHKNRYFITDFEFFFNIAITKTIIIDAAKLNSEE